MLTVFSRELKALTRDIKAIVCVALTVVISGTLFTLNNMITGYAGLEAVLSTMSVVSAILIIFLSVFMVNKDKKSGTDLLWSTLPFTKLQVLLGKLSALFVWFMIPTAVIAVYPLVLLRYGFNALGIAYTQLFVYATFQLFFIAFGLLLSALFKKAWQSMLVAYSVIVACFALGVIAAIMPGSALAGLLCFLAVALLCGGGLWLATKQPVIAAVVTAVGMLVPTVMFFAFPDALVGSFEAFFKFLSPFRHFDHAMFGFFDWGAVVLYISFSALFVWLALLAQKHKKTVKTKPRRPADFRRSALCVSVAAVCLCANLTVYALPSRFTRLDITQNRIYEVSSFSQSYLKGLDQDINIYLIDAIGNEEKLGNYIKRYCEYSNKLHLIEVDSLKDTDIMKKFGIDSNVSYYSVVVESEKRFKLVDADKYFEYTHSDYDEPLTPAEYSYLTSESYCKALLEEYKDKGDDVLQLVYEQFLSLKYDAVLKFKAEKAITSAIEEVTAEYVPTVYYLSGNGETLMGDEKLDINSTQIPVDAGMLVINAPTTDYTDAQVAALTSFTSKGGRLFVVSNEENLKMPNFTRLMASYGLSAGEDKLLYKGNSKLTIAVNTNLVSTNAPFTKLEGVHALRAEEGINAYPLLAAQASEEQVVEEKAEGGSEEEAEGSADENAEGSTEGSTEDATEEPKTEIVDVYKSAGIVVLDEKDQHQVIWITGAESFNASGAGLSGDALTAHTSRQTFLSDATSSTKKNFEPKNTYPIPKQYDSSLLSVSEGELAKVGVIFIGLVPAALAGSALIVIYARRRRSRAVIVEE